MVNIKDELNIKPYQACRSSDGWVPVEVPSSSVKDTKYTVMVCPWGVGRENICDCAGYFFRGSCKHQTEAMDLVCGWTELQVPAKFSQDPTQRKEKVCPRCGGPTIWRMEVDE